jgi:mannosyltransferase
MQLIFDNIIYALQQTGGGSVYWTELMRRFADTDDAVTFIEHRGAERNLFRQTLSIHPAARVVERRPLRIGQFLPVPVGIRGKALFHSSYYRYATRPGVINVTTIHDFTTELLRTGIRQAVNLRQKRQALRHSDGIICISQHTKSDLLKIFPWVDRRKIRVIYNGVSNSFFPLPDSTRQASGRPFILYVGVRKGYKNFAAALEALCLLPEDFTLLAVGNAFEKKEMQEIRRCGLQDRVSLANRPSGEELNALYNAAYCLLYPSSYEGFGIPVAEAMRAGCPVVALRASSIPEVAGLAAILVERPEPELLARATLSVDGAREELISKGIEQAKRFSWDTCFAQVYDFYKELYG